MVLLIVFAVGGLVGCWVWGDATARTKGVLTALYLASWGLLLVPVYGSSLFPVAQCAFAIMFCAMAFGIDWLMRDAWHVR